MWICREQSHLQIMYYSCISHFKVMHHTSGLKCNFTSIEKACGHFSIIILLGSGGRGGSLSVKESIDASSSDVNRAAVNGGSACSLFAHRKHWRRTSLEALGWSDIVLSQQVTMQQVKCKIQSYECVLFNSRITKEHTLYYTAVAYFWICFLWLDLQKSEIICPLAKSVKMLFQFFLSKL